MLQRRPFSVDGALHDESAGGGWPGAFHIFLGQPLGARMRTDTEKLTWGSCNGMK